MTGGATDVKRQADLTGGRCRCAALLRGERGAAAPGHIISDLPARPKPRGYPLLYGHLGQTARSEGQAARAVCSDRDRKTTSSKLTLASRQRELGKPAFRLYEDVFDQLGADHGADAPVYLRLERVSAELSTPGVPGKSVVTIAFPRELAVELGLVRPKS